MVNFICQVDLAMGCPDIGAQVLDQALFWMLMWVFGDERNMKTSRMKANGLPNEVGLIWSVESLRKTTRQTYSPLNKREFPFPDCLWMGTSAFCCPQTRTEISPVPQSQTCSSLGWTHSTGVSWVSGLPAHTTRSWVLAASTVVRAIPSN